MIPVPPDPRHSMDDETEARPVWLVVIDSGGGPRNTDWETERDAWTFAGMEGVGVSARVLAIQRRDPDGTLTTLAPTFAAVASRREVVGAGADAARRLAALERQVAALTKTVDRLVADHDALVAERLDRLDGRV